MKPSLLDQLPFLIVFTKGLSDSQVSVAMAADKEPVHFCTADSACEACWRKAITEMGLHAEQQHGCHTFLGALVRRGRAGQQRELPARGSRVGAWAQPCRGQTGIAWQPRACWVPPCPVTAGSLLDTAVRGFWLSLTTCNREDLTIRLHLKHSLHPRRFCYSKLLATRNRVMYLDTF